MRALRIALGLLLVLAVTAGIGTAAAAQEQTQIVVAAGGTDRVWMVPKSEPYTQGGPSVGVPVSRFDVRTADDRIITGFEFIAWTEGDGIRVMVFALVPKDGEPNIYMGADLKRLQRQDFATYQLAVGESRPVEKMKTLDIEPMVIRAELRP